MMKKIYTYSTLYPKSLNFVWKPSKSIMLSMILMAPIQSVLPFISIFISNINFKRSSV